MSSSLTPATTLGNCRKLHLQLPHGRGWCPMAIALALALRRLTTVARGAQRPAAHSDLTMSRQGHSRAASMLYPHAVSIGIAMHAAVGAVHMLARRRDHGRDDARVSARPHFLKNESLPVACAYAHATYDSYHVSPWRHGAAHVAPPPPPRRVRVAASRVCQRDACQQHPESRTCHCQRSYVVASLNYYFIIIVENLGAASLYHTGRARTALVLPMSFLKTAMDKARTRVGRVCAKPSGAVHFFPATVAWQQHATCNMRSSARARTARRAHPSCSVASGPVSR